MIPSSGDNGRPFGHFFLGGGVSGCLTSTWCLTSTETIRLIRDGKKGEGSMEVVEEGDYTPIATLTTRMTPALRCAAMRSILMFYREGQTHKTVSTNHNLCRREGAAEAESSRRHKY